MSLLVSLVGLASLALAEPAPSDQGGSAPSQEDALATLDHAALSAAVDALASAHPHVVVSELGRSRDGRVIQALTIARDGAAGDRPGLLIVGGLQGEEAFSSMLALHHARALAEGYGEDERVTALLDAWTVHVVPRANPDAVEALFETPKRVGGPTGSGVDDDRDGRQGEDPWADVDGDGLVTWMRYEDPEGTWLPDPTDPRALVEADRSKGERGRWKLVREGLDTDGDERVAEDGPRNAVVDRNFPAGWDEHAQDAGRWPTDEPEALALVEFVLAHPSLTTVVVYGAHDDLVEVPKGVADDAPDRLRIPPSGMRASDVEALKRIAERYRETTGNETTGTDDDAGSFQRWAYEHRGLLVLCARPWSLPTRVEEAAGEDGDAMHDAADDSEAAVEVDLEEDFVEEHAVDEVPHQEHGEDAIEETLEEDRPEQPRGARGRGDAPGSDDDADDAKPSDDAKRLAWIDAHPEEAWRFDAWQAFEHPQLGAVEVGGFTPYSHTEPPAAARAELASKHLDWLLTLVDERPRLAIQRFEAERLGEGLWQVELVLENTGRMPYLTRAAELTRTQRPARVTLVLPDGATLLAGSRQTLASDLRAVDGRFEEAWLVQAADAGALRVEIDTDHAEDLSATAEVQR